MKKLLFAIAGAASFAAFAADPSAGAGDIDVLGFENFDLTSAEVTGAVIQRTDAGITGDSKWSCSGDDASLVKAYGGENAAAPSGLTFPAPFDGAGDNYLALDTNGSELQRAVGATVAADGTYIDTLVQFTPSESAPTSTDLDGAKLAIWLGVDSEHNTTNLMVQGSSWDFDQAPTGASQAFALTGKTIEPGTWYRLTVKAIPNFMNEDSGLSIPAFQILVDGTEMTLATAPLSAGFLELLDQSSMYASADIKAAMTANKLVPSIQDEAGAYGATVTLTSVGFKGTGALDDFVVTTAARDYSAPPVDFTLTWPAGLTAVSYTLDGVDGEAVTIADGTATIHGTNGAPVTLTGSIGYANKTVTGSITQNGTLALGALDISYYFPMTATADQDGTASHPYEIADETGLNAFKAATAAGFGKTLAYQLTADVALTEAWPGIGTYDNTTNADAFEGIFDGAGHRISNVLFADNETGGNAASTANNYRGFFNQVNGATIKNLTIQWNGWAPNVSTTEFGGAAFVGCANNATLECLTAEGTVTAGTHNNAGIAVRASGLTAPTTFSNCTNKMALTGNYTKLGGMCAITQAGTSTVTFDGCVNEGSITAVAVTGATNAGRDGVAGILGYAANGDGNTIINACVNTGTIDVSAGYSGTHSGYTGAKAGQLLGWANNSASLTGANMVGTGLVAVGAYSANKTSGQNFATVSGTTATMIADADVAPGQTQYMAMTEKAAYQFTAAGTLIVDEALKAATVTVDGEGLTLTSATVGTVTTYTVTAPSQGVDIEPGQQDATVYPDAAAATAALASVTIVEPDDVKTNETITAQAKTDYDALFEAKVVEVSGGYAIEVGLTAAAETTLQEQANGDAAEIVDAIDDTEVTFTTTPGLYYSIEYGTSLSLGSETEKVMATGSTLTLDMPAKSGNSGFYKVKISITK